MRTTFILVRSIAEHVSIATFAVSILHHLWFLYQWLLIQAEINSQFAMHNVINLFVMAVTNGALTAAIQHPRSGATFFESW